MAIVQLICRQRAASAVLRGLAAHQQNVCGPGSHVVEAVMSVWCDSLLDENLPVSQILPRVVLLLPPGLPSRSISRTVSSELLGLF